MQYVLSEEEYSALKQSAGSFHRAVADAAKKIALGYRKEFSKLLDVRRESDAPHYAVRGSVAYVEVTDLQRGIAVANDWLCAQLGAVLEAPAGVVGGTATDRLRWAADRIEASVRKDAADENYGDWIRFARACRACAQYLERPKDCPNTDWRDSGTRKLPAVPEKFRV